MDVHTHSSRQTDYNPPTYHLCTLSSVSHIYAYLNSPKTVDSWGALLISFNVPLHPSAFSCHPPSIFASLPYSAKGNSSRGLPYGLVSERLTACLPAACMCVCFVYVFISFLLFSLPHLFLCNNRPDLSSSHP